MTGHSPWAAAHFSRVFHRGSDLEALGHPQAHPVSLTRPRFVTRAGSTLALLKLHPNISVERLVDGLPRNLTSAPLDVLHVPVDATDTGAVPRAEPRLRWRH